MFDLYYLNLFEFLEFSFKYGILEVNETWLKSVVDANIISSIEKIEYVGLEEVYAVVLDHPFLSKFRILILTM